VGLLAQLTKLKAPLLDLDVVAKEEGRREEYKAEKVDTDFKSLLRDSQMSDLGGFLTKYEDIENSLSKTLPPLSH